MPRTPKTRSGTIPIKHRPSRDKWELTLHRQGKRSRTLYATQEAAEKAWKEHVAKLAREGRDGRAISQAEGVEYLEAKRIVSGLDLRKVAQFWRDHHPEGGQDATLSEAWSRYIAEKGANGLSKRHVDTLRYHLTKFVQFRGKRPVRIITGEEIRGWLTGLPFDARTIANHKGSFAAFFNWCRRRKLVAVSPVADIHDADLPAVRPKPKGVLSVDQCAAMMAWLETHRPKWVPAHALQLFAGIRHAEVSRLDWSMIDRRAKVVTLPGWTEDGDRVIKTGDDWALHDLPWNLWDWLDAYAGTGPVYSPDGKAVAKVRQESFPTIGIPSWPDNALRHTFCTMLMSLHGDAAKVANWSRHTNAAQLYKSYVARLVSREEAGRFCEIRPTKSPSQVATGRGL